MRLYDRWVVPWLIDLAMRNRALLRCRDRALAAARGDILEIGVGAGINLPRYGAGAMAELIRAAGRHLDALAAGYMPGPKPWTFMYEGSATR